MEKIFILTGLFILALGVTLGLLFGLVFEIENKGDAPDGDTGKRNREEAQEDD